MKRKVFLIMAGLWIGLLGLTACGRVNGCTYRYPETTVLFDDFHIKKTVYRPGVMKLYYRGRSVDGTVLSGSLRRCRQTHLSVSGDSGPF